MRVEKIKELKDELHETKVLLDEAIKWLLEDAMEEWDRRDILENIKERSWRNVNSQRDD